MAFSLTSLIPGLSEVQWVASGVAALALVGGTVYVTHHWDSASYEKLVAAQATAQAKAVTAQATKQKALDTTGTAAAASDAQAQVKIVDHYITVTKEVPTYVDKKQDLAAVAPGAAPGCISYGLVRLLDAAVLGVDPSTLALPAGQSDDACSPVEPSALAEGIAGNYSVAEQNAQQLNDLIAAAKAQAVIVAAPQK